MKILLNPYWLFCFSYVVMYLLGLLGWSSLFSNYSSNVNAIFFTIVIISFILGFFRYNKVVRASKYYPINKSKNDDKMFYFVLLFFLIEMLYSRNLPILQSNYSDILDMNFGVPLLHGFFVPFISYLSILFFHQYLSSKEKKYILYVIVLNVLILLLMRRGLIVFNSLCYMFVFIFYASYKFNKVNFLKTKLIAISLVILFVFGVIGNNRLGDETGGDLILNRGGATQEFKDSGIPKTFFFAYMYVASPIHVLDANLHSHKNDIESFLLNNIVPEFISKRIRSSEFKKEFETLNGFNVGGLFLQPYYDYGIWGIVFVYLYMCLFIELTLFFSTKNNKRALVSYAILLSIILLLTFTNLLVSTGYILPLFYCWIFRGIKIK